MAAHRFVAVVGARALSEAWAPQVAAVRVLPGARMGHRLRRGANAAVRNVRAYGVDF